MSDNGATQHFKSELTKALDEMADAEYADAAAADEADTLKYNKEHPAPPVEERDKEPNICILRIDQKECTDGRYLVEFFVDEKKICDITAFLGGTILKDLMRIIRIFCVIDISCGFPDQVFLRYKNEKIGIGFSPVTMSIYNEYYCVNRDPVMGFDITFYDKKKKRRRRKVLHGDRRAVTKAFYDFITRIDPSLRDKDLEDIFMLNFTDHFNALSKGHFTDYERRVRDEERAYRDEYKIGLIKSVVENIEIQDDGSALVVFKVDSFTFTFLDDMYKKHKKRYKCDKSVELHLVLFCSDIKKINAPKGFDKDDLNLKPTNKRAVYEFSTQVHNIETDGVFDYTFLVHSIRKTPKITHYLDFDAPEDNTLLMHAYITEPAELHLKDGDVIKGICYIKARDFNVVAV